MCQCDEEITLKPRIQQYYFQGNLRPIILPALGERVLDGIRMNMSKIPILLTAFYI